MNNRNLLFALTLTCILLAFGAWTLSFFHYGAPVRQTPASQIAAPMQAGPSAEVQFNPPRPQDNPFRSFATILRCVFELFWLTWKTRRSQRRQPPAANPAQEDGSL